MISAYLKNYNDKGHAVCTCYTQEILQQKSIYHLIAAKLVTMMIAVARIWNNDQNYSSVA